MKLKNNKSKYKIVVSIVIALIIIFTCAIGGYIYYLTSKLNRVHVDRADVTNTGKDVPKKIEDITTIAIFGTDLNGLKEGKDGNSDATMLLSIDEERKQLNLCSLMRDTYLDLPNGEKENLNYIGEPADILKAINYNYELKVDKFIHIDLINMAKAIDIVGGIELNLTKSEVDYINRGYPAHDKLSGTKSRPLSMDGKNILTGAQAVVHARNRSTNGWDFKRTERQREIMNALFSKMKTISLKDIPSMLDKLLPLVNTNISNGEVLSLAYKVIGMDINNIDQSRFPEEGDYTTEITDKFHILIDKNITIKKIYKFLYGID